MAIFNSYVKLPEGNHEKNEISPSQIWDFTITNLGFDYLDLSGSI